MRAVVVVLFLTAAVLPFGAGASGQSLFKNQPQRVAVTGRASAPVTKAGQRLELLVEVKPQPGIHLYAPGNPDYIAVSIGLAAVDGLTVGTPIYPAAEPYFFAPLKESVKVYSKPFQIRVPLTVHAAFLERKSATDGVTLTGSFAYQACDDKVCFPPQTLSFSVPVAVRPARH